MKHDDFSTLSRDSLSVDLVAAARRSDDFAPELTDDELARRVERYIKFLGLAGRHPGWAVAPTREIDEMWHLHMLHPVAYYQDCQRIAGGLLDHDGGFGKAPEEAPVLERVFRRTETLWAEAYGEPYVAEAESAVKCWHDCQGRCWHACKSVQASDPLLAAQAA
jgi:hypothetical protein